jgi:small-conductance mechanosensitive channel
LEASHRDESRARAASANRALTLSGTLLLVGFVMNAIQRMLLHPSGAEDDHEEIFTEYAESDVWVFTHFLEFVLVLVAFAGLLVLCRALRPEAPSLALLAAGAIVMTSATWAVLQGIDGVTLKQAVDAWAESSGSEQATRFADAETVRWAEWGLQSYFRVVLGLAFLLLGAAAVVSRLVPSWLGVLLAIAGLLSLAIGISVGYAGLESGFQDAAALAFQLAVIVFVVGLLVAGRGARAAGAPRRLAPR